MKKIIKTIPDKISKKVYKVYDPIFRQKIWVLLNHSSKDYEQFLNKRGIKDVGDKEFYFNRVSGFATYIEPKDDEPREYLILLKEFDWSIFHQGTLIHEITHIVFRIFESNNIPFNQDTQEFIAHSIGGIYESIARKLLVLVIVE